MGWGIRSRLGVMLLTIVVAGLSSISARATTPDPRAAETAIELAWLADPITYPYSLRAFLKNNVLEVHGQVPSMFVRKQALAIARLFANAPVLDQTDLIPGCAKTFVAAPKDKVQKRIHDRIARGLPQLTKLIVADCDDEGRVTLTGSAPSLAEKMALADLVRSAPGVMVCVNRVSVAAVLPPTAIQTVAHTAPAPAPAMFKRPVTNETTEIMREKLIKMCPTATQMGVLQTGPRRFQIQFIARTDDEASRLATLIFNQAEWSHLRLDIGAHVPR